jgi:hypothetical protein
MPFFVKGDGTMEEDEKYVHAMLSTFGITGSTVLHHRHPAGHPVLREGHFPTFDIVQPSISLYRNIKGSTVGSSISKVGEVPDLEAQSHYPVADILS